MIGRRVLIAVTVSDDWDLPSLAIAADYHLGSDATAWFWEGFWKDVSDGVIDPDGDSTSTVSEPERGPER